ncbi:MAG TPA: glycerol-3-phosphate dehydrogenase/oxidase [Gemmatimonadaceae bacterium]|nr:glycerol-3-phosphate dehydrogenase/oxidase [Gemmatimonadaceae bacterium]
MALQSALSRPEVLRQLRDRTFDLLVVGGGINGCGIARDAAMRGLSVALVEKNDFGSGTSGRSSRMIHGGVRYLEHGHFRLVAEASSERRILLRIAPHLVQPMEFVWPLYAGGRVPRWKLLAGLGLYDAFAAFRNTRRHERLSARGVLAREPAIRADELTGGAVYYDAVTDDARLTLANALAARAAGALVLNHAEAVIGQSLQSPVLLNDRLTDREVHVTARAVVVAVGPWDRSVRGTKGSHVLVSRARTGQERAITFLSAEDQRVLFMVPDGDMTLIGTTDVPTTESPETVRASTQEIDYLLRSASAVLACDPLRSRDVVAAWAAIRPLAAQAPTREPASLSREHAIEMRNGAIVVTGGKLTTYRRVAAEVVDRVVKELRMSLPPAHTDRVPLPGADRQARIVQAISENPALSGRITPESAHRKAELAVAARDEAAQTLGDLLIRRTRIAFRLGDRGLATAPAVADVVAPILGWDKARRNVEVERFAEEVDAMFSVAAPARGERPRALSASRSPYRVSS